MKEERIDLTDWEIPEGTRLTELDAAIQELTNELKRCYEKIDALQGKIDSAHEVMEKYSNEEIDNVCDAYEEVCMAL